MKMRWKVLIGLVVVAAIPVGLVVWNYWPMGRVKLVISPETTYITEPLTAEGYPDYATVINAKLAAGTRQQDNAAIDILHAVGIDVIPEEYRAEALAALGLCESMFADDPPAYEPFEVFRQRYMAETGEEIPDQYDLDEILWEDPKAIADHPYVLTWLAENEAAIDRVLLASTREVFYWPVLPELATRPHDPYRPVWFRINDISVWSFRFRWAAGLAACNVNDVLLDYVSLLRLRRIEREGVRAHLNDCFSMRRLTDYAIEAIRDGTITRGGLIRLRDTFRSLPPGMPMAELMEVERLQLIMGLISQWQLGGPDSKIFSCPVPSVDWVAVDINLVLQRLNECIDLEHKMFASQTYSEALALDGGGSDSSNSALQPSNQKRRNVWEIIQGRLGRRAHSEAVSDEIEAIFRGSDCLLARLIAEGRVNERKLELAIALRLYEFDHGEYPESLNTLVPQYLPVVPDDPFDGATMRYRRIVAGCVVYSVGENLIDDEGQGLDYQPVDYDEWIDDADDIAVALGVPNAYDE